MALKSRVHAICLVNIQQSCLQDTWTINSYYIGLQADPNMDVRERMINAGIMIIDKHGRENVSLLFPIFENYLNKKV